MDDFKGWFCNLGPFPIIESIKEEFEHKFVLIDMVKNNTTYQTKPVTKQTAPDTKVTNNRIKPKTTTVTIPPSKTNGAPNATKIPADKNTDNKQMGIKNNEYEKIGTSTQNSKVPIKDEQSPSNKSDVESSKNELNLESIARSVKKKFKAVREIQIYACLNKKLCHLKSSSNNVTSNLFMLNLLFLFFISNMISKLTILF